MQRARWAVRGVRGAEGAPRGRPKGAGLVGEAQDSPGRGAPGPAAARGGNPDLPGKPHRPLRAARIPPPPSVPPAHPRRDCSRIWGVRVISQQGGTRALSHKGIAPSPPRVPGAGSLAAADLPGGGARLRAGASSGACASPAPGPPSTSSSRGLAFGPGAGGRGREPRGPAGPLGGSQAEPCPGAGALAEVGPQGPGARAGPRERGVGAGAQARGVGGDGLRGGL